MLTATIATTTINNDNNNNNNSNNNNNNRDLNKDNQMPKRGRKRE